jgi:hypothetical protein
MEATTYMRTISTNDVIVFDETLSAEQAHTRDRLRGDAYIQYLIEFES